MSRTSRRISAKAIGGGLCLMLHIAIIFAPAKVGYGMPITPMLCTGWLLTGVVATALLRPNLRWAVYAALASMVLFSSSLFHLLLMLTHAYI